ncbi:MAG: hypothetical protein CVV53_02520 [Spirochaetae bacterium HGW-Spirochaetae-9]|nr:MAG: hypothetical protein CVV53_02520 [Spirochaetae bacterium HGW-Spirochaetae-9]
MRAQALARLPEPAFLIDRLKEAGCPVRLADIGLDRNSLYRGFIIASLIRQRYTTLDLADEFGLLESFAKSASSWDTLLSDSPSMEVEQCRKNQAEN